MEETQKMQIFHIFSDFETYITRQKELVTI